MSVKNFISEVWASQILTAFQAGTALVNTVRDYSRYARAGDGGSTVHVASFTTPTLSSIYSSRDITPQALADDGLDINLNNAKGFAMLVDDIDRAQAAGNLDQVTQQAVDALIEDAETYIASLLLSGGTNGDPGGTSSPTTISDGNDAFTMVMSLRRQLSQLKTPPAGRYLAVNPLFSEYLLGADSKLSEVDTSGSSQGLRDATIGRLLGFNVVESPVLSSDQACCVAYHQSSIGWVSQLDKVESLRSTAQFADIVRGLHLYGAQALRSDGVLYWQAAAS